MSKIINQIRLIGIISIIVLANCNPKHEEVNGCTISGTSPCKTTSWSIVDADTYENLVGIDKLIHPDSIYVLNSRNDTMYHEIHKFSWGWVEITNFSPFQELYCFNQCKLDSTFSRFYYMYLGNDDFDTIEVLFEKHKSFYSMFFNDISGEVPKDRPLETGDGLSVFWFRKKINK